PDHRHCRELPEEPACRDDRIRRHEHVLEPGDGSRVSFGQIWEELERVTPPGKSGRVKRRIKPEANCDLFLALAKPANLRMVLMLVQAGSLGGIDELPTASGVEARIARPGQAGSDATLDLVLTDPRSE